MEKTANRKQGLICITRQGQHRAISGFIMCSASTGSDSQGLSFPPGRGHSYFKEDVMNTLDLVDAMEDLSKLEDSCVDEGELI